MPETASCCSRWFRLSRSFCLRCVFLNKAKDQVNSRGSAHPLSFCSSKQFSNISRIFSRGSIRLCSSQFSKTKFWYLALLTSGLQTILVAVLRAPGLGLTADRTSSALLLWIWWGYSTGRSLGPLGSWHASLMAWPALAPTCVTQDNTSCRRWNNTPAQRRKWSQISQDYALHGRSLTLFGLEAILHIPVAGSET